MRATTVTGVGVSRCGLVLDLRCAARVLGAGRTDRTGVVGRRGAGGGPAHLVRRGRPVGVALLLLLIGILGLALSWARLEGRGGRLVVVMTWLIAAALVLRSVVVEVLLLSGVAGVRDAVGPGELPASWGRVCGSGTCGSCLAGSCSLLRPARPGPRLARDGPPRFARRKPIISEYVRSAIP